MNPWERAQINLERHYTRRRENEILRGRFFPSLGHYFTVAAEIRAIRIRDAERDYAAITN